MLGLGVCLCRWDGLGLVFSIFFSYSEVLTSSWIVWFAKNLRLIVRILLDD